MSQSLLGVQLVWEQREKKREIAARGCVSFTSPVPPVKLRRDQYLSKTLYNKGDPKGRHLLYDEGL